MTCPRCAGYDPHCSHCVSSRLARKHGTEFSLATDPLPIENPKFDAVARAAEERYEAMKERLG